MTQSKTPLLDRVRTPADLRKPPVEDLGRPADELRAESESGALDAEALDARALAAFEAGGAASLIA